jgi:hypothetical protein
MKDVFTHVVFVFFLLDWMGNMLLILLQITCVFAVVEQYLLHQRVKCPQCPSFSRRRRKYQAFSEKDDEQYHRSYNFKWKIPRRKCTFATHSNDSERYAFRVQTRDVRKQTSSSSNKKNSTT